MEKIRRKLNSLEKHLKDNIKGQDYVISKLCDSLKRGEFEITDKTMPKGAFLFLGTTGVGKTELTITFTDYLFGPGKLHRFDMSEFMHFDTVKEFRGDHDRPGRLPLVLEKHDHGTLLFDEMEKSHPDILMLFLQMLSAARITGGNGKTYDLSNFYFVFTSNIGSDKMVRFRNSDYVAMEQAVKNAVQRTLKKEFIGRLHGNLIVFKKLEYEVQREIAELILEREVKRLAKLGYELEYEEEIVEFLVRKGIDVQYGARPMKNCVQSYLQNAIVEAFLAGDDKPSGKLIEVFENGCQKLTIQDAKVWRCANDT